VTRSVITPEFVDFVPEDLDPGVLYVSMRFSTVVHLCPCGCGNKVVTPLSPPEWHLLYDGETVSLMPSVGNWQFPCRSHYWIRQNRIKWARSWSDDEISAGRLRDAHEIEAYFASRVPGAEVEETPARSMKPESRPFARLRRWFGH